MEASVGSSVMIPGSLSKPAILGQFFVEDIKVIVEILYQSARV